jgi:Gpi18-like mannosyltransferase
MAELVVAEQESIPQPAGRSWKERNRWLWLPIVAFFITRLMLVLPMYLSQQEIPDNRFIEPYHVWPTNIAIDTLGGRWDTGFYLNISQEGYHYFGEDVVFPSVAFFPALSTLMVLFAPLFGGQVILSGLFVTNLALLAASILLYRLVALEFSEATAGRSVWYLLIFPTSLFGSAIYTESLFLLCAVGAFFAARRGRWG